MKNDCTLIEERLADDPELQGDGDAQARAHVADCPSCQELRRALEEIERGFRELPSIEPPPELVERVLTSLPRPVAEIRDERPGRRSPWMALFAGVFARRLATVGVTMAGILGVVGIIGWLGSEAKRPQMVGMSGPIEDYRSPRQSSAPYQPAKPVGEASNDRANADPASKREPASGHISTSAATPAPRGAVAPPPPASRIEAGQVLPDNGRYAGAAGASFGERAIVETTESEVSHSISNELMANVPADGWREPQTAASGPAGQADPDLYLGKDGRLDVIGGVAGAVEKKQSERRGAKLDQDRNQQAKELDALGYLAGERGAARSDRPDSTVAGKAQYDDDLRNKLNEENRDQEAGTFRQRKAGDKSKVATAGSESETETRLLLRDASAGEPVAEPTPAPPPPVPDAFQRFLAERARTEGLHFLPSRGYWANTYIPGDPAMRALAERLRLDRPVIAGPDGQALALDELARPYQKPLDPPTASALSLTVEADRAAVAGKTRLLVQVGLRASDRHGLARAPLTLAVVVDRTAELDAETAASARALLLSLAQARRAGDRFALFVAGERGGMVVGPESFRHGPLAVALEPASSRGTGNARSSGDDDDAPPAVNLPAALEQAMTMAAHAGESEATLGASSVWLVTTRPLGDQLATLTRMAHASALNGIPLTVVALGAQAPLAEVDRLVLAGQGNRRILARPAEAQALVERELAASARSVARAVRLNIRLAQGVRLVGIPGSCPLDEVEAQEVRDAERSIDLRLYKALGLEADRGDDEDGIQIVIPSFHAGDGHAILLDLVAEKPGAVVEVTARYKDLVGLRNGLARASLSLPASGPGEATPLARGVLKGLVALDLADSLRAAASRLAGGDDAGAARDLAAARDLVQGLGQAQGFRADPELQADLLMTSQYLAALAGGAASEPATRAFLAESLANAANKKLIEPMETEP